jgi:peptidoglycan/xylan/chitin deacetylase (PgdA/CDA1 family)
MYHSVDVNDSFYTVLPGEFARQIEYVTKNYNILNLDEILDFVEGKRNLPKKAVAITFDDGYYDNYLNAYPYLRERSLPAAVFVSTSRVGLSILLDSVPLKALGWNEIVEMSQNNVMIGAHTVNHPDLSGLSLDRAKQEIQGSRTAIEQRIGKKVDYFSYPFGRHNKQVITLVRSLGFKAAVTGGEGLIHRGSPTYLLNRVQVDKSIPFFMFKVRLSRGLSWYKKALEFARLSFGSVSA